MKKATSKPDTYLPVLQEHWDALTRMYVAFEELEPMMEFDVASGQIRACSAREYLAGLSKRTREKTRKQYKKAVAEGALMVFVRDESRKVLRSYVFAPARESSMRVGRKKGGNSLFRPAPRMARPKGGVSMNDSLAGIHRTLHAIYSRHCRKHRENPDSKQMCCMWSTNNPPDIIEGTKPIRDIEDAFGIQISDEEAVELYDMHLDQAVRMIIEIGKKKR